MAVENQLRQQEEKLPKVESQQALRGQKYGEGMQGRVFRKQILGAKGDIQSQQQQVQDYSQAIGEAQKQVTEYEQSLNQPSANPELEKVYQAGREGRVLMGLSGSKLEAYRQGKDDYNAGLSKMQSLRSIKQMKDAGLNPIFDQQGNMVGIEDVNLQKTYAVGSDISIPEELVPKYQQAGFTFEEPTAPIPQVPSGDLILNSKSIGVMPRTEKVQVTQELLPAVSAQSLYPKKETMKYEPNVPSGVSDWKDNKLQPGNIFSTLIGTTSDSYKGYKAAKEPKEAGAELNPVTGKPWGLVSAVPEPKGFLERLRAKITKGNVKSDNPFLGAASSGLGTVEFGASLISPTKIKNPAQTGIKNPAQMGYANPLQTSFLNPEQLQRTSVVNPLQGKIRNPLQGKITNPIQTRVLKLAVGASGVLGKIISGAGLPEVGVMLRERPKYSTGFALAEAAQYKGPAIAVRAVDVYRTTGKIELNMEDIIAPEYFAGQKYPKVAKGQTAGELLEEFKQPEVYGATRLRGFTASPVPFKKETLALKGTSELPGVYQAPKLSPTFLRIAGEEEKTLFGLNPLGTVRPTAMLTKPKEFELISGVSKGQKEIGSLSKAKSFFEDVAVPGKSYVPWVKTEKESVILAGTKLKQTGSRFFFRFEGRRVPILEFEALAEGTKAAGSATETLGSIYSRYAPKSKSIINPYSGLVSASLIPESRASTVSKTSQVNLISRSSSESPISSRLSYARYFGDISKPKSTSTSKSKPSSSYKSYIDSIISKVRIPSSYKRITSSKSYSLISLPSFEPRSSSYRIPPSKPKTVYSQKGGKIVKVGEGRYVVFVRRFGTDQIVGEAETLEQAKKILKYNLQESLAASGFVAIKGSNKKVDVKDMFGDMFVPSKRDRFRVVQKRGKRLSSRSEVSEIWSFKTMKGSKGRKKINWW